MKLFILGLSMIMLTHAHNSISSQAAPSSPLIAEPIASSSPSAPSTVSSQTSNEINIQAVIEKLEILQSHIDNHTKRNSTAQMDPMLQTTLTTLPHMINGFIVIAQGDTHKDPQMVAQGLSVILNGMANILAVALTPTRNSNNSFNQETSLLNLINTMAECITIVAQATFQRSLIEEPLKELIINKATEISKCCMVAHALREREKLIDNQSESELDKAGECQSWPNNPSCGELSYC